MLSYVAESMQKNQVGPRLRKACVKSDLIKGEPVRILV